MSKHGLKLHPTDQFSQGPTAGQAAVQDMTSNVNSRHENTSKDGTLSSSSLSTLSYPTQHAAPDDLIPPLILAQITTCATATNEFLRQFWSALYPPPPPTDSLSLGTLTTAQRETKIIKMAGYIARTREKVGAVILTAQHAGVELSVVETVSIGVAFWHQNWDSRYGRVFLGIRSAFGRC